jgi:hypothetical protein
VGADHLQRSGSAEWLPGMPARGSGTAPSGAGRGNLSRPARVEETCALTCRPHDPRGAVTERAGRVSRFLLAGRIPPVGVGRRVGVVHFVGLPRPRGAGSSDTVAQLGTTSDLPAQAPTIPGETRGGASRDAVWRDVVWRDVVWHRPRVREERSARAAGGDPFGDVTGTRPAVRPAGGHRSDQPRIRSHPTRGLGAGGVWILALLGLLVAGCRRAEPLRQSAAATVVAHPVRAIPPTSRGQTGDLTDVGEIAVGPLPAGTGRELVGLTGAASGPTAGSVVVSVDDGHRFQAIPTPATSGLATAAGIVLGHHGTIYLGGEGEVIDATSDRGRSWHQVRLPGTVVALTAATHHVDALVTVAKPGEPLATWLWSSGDAGEVWTRETRLPGLAGESASFVADGPGRLVAALWGGPRAASGLALEEAGQWRRRSDPCGPDAALQLVAGRAGDVWLACDGSGTPRPGHRLFAVTKELWVATDSSAWRLVAASADRSVVPLPLTGTLDTLDPTGSGVVVGLCPGGLRRIAPVAPGGHSGRSTSVTAQVLSGIPETTCVDEAIDLGRGKLAVVVGTPGLAGARRLRVVPAG